MEIIQQNYYHLQRINEVNIKWKVGDKLTFDTNQENYYYKGLKNAIREIQTEHGFPNILVNNIENKLLSRISNQYTQNQLDELLNAIDSAPHKNKVIQYFQELIYEYVRKRKFSYSPSRHHCIWVVPKRNDLVEWEEIVLSHRSRILKLNLTGKTLRTTGTLICTEKNRHLMNAFENAVKYWKLDFTTEKEIEYLFEGTFIIDEEIID